MASDTDERRAALLAAKLRGLTRERRGDASPTVDLFGGSAAVRAEGQGWFLTEDDAIRSLGPALAWARRHRVDDLQVVVDDPEVAGVLARRAGAFTPAPTVSSVDGDRLVTSAPAPFRAEAEPPEGVETLISLLDLAGVEVVLEHGQYTGEVQGLEVARVTVGEHGPSLEVGVGRNDREAFGLVHADVPPADALASVVSTVQGHRRPGTTAHPLNRLAASRWLRALAIDRPGDLGLTELAPRPLTHARDGVKESHPAAATGRDGSGRRVVAVFSVGIDLDLVPTAADVRLHERAGDAPVDRLLLVVPHRDAVPVTRGLADSLSEPAEIVTVDDRWWE